MSDARFFARGKVQELRTELLSDKKDKNHTRKKTVLKKIVANMTMSNDMSALFPDIINCLSIPDIEIKKMCFLFLINYARLKPEMSQQSVGALTEDLRNHNPLIRALTLRTLSYIPLQGFVTALLPYLRNSGGLLRDADPYVRKTAALAVAKLYAFSRREVEASGCIDILRSMLADTNPTVVASAICALGDIAARSGDTSTELLSGIKINFTIASRLVSVLSDCSEWSQTYTLEAIMSYVPQDPADAAILAERISPRLQHANSAVVLACTKVILYLMNYMASEAEITVLSRKLSPPLITLLGAKGPEVQFVALRNAQLIVAQRPEVLKGEIRVFFCKYNDPIYVKLAKLEMIVKLATEETIDQVLTELKEYATEIDVDFVRKSVRLIGRLAVKLERAAKKCIAALLDLVSTKVSYVVQEATVVIKDIFRKYPGEYESIIATLCSNLDSLDEPEAKAAMIWVVGEYADRIENADELLEDFLYTWSEEPVEVQLALLTATVKLFIARPAKGADLVPKVLKWATEDANNPDLRDRGYMYWRLLSTDPASAKHVVTCEKPRIRITEELGQEVLEELVLNVGMLASVYHKLPQQFVRGARGRGLQPSPALRRRRVVEDDGDEDGEVGTGESQNGYQDMVNGFAGMNMAGAANPYATFANGGMGGYQHDVVTQNGGGQGFESAAYPQGDLLML
ncbi:hypothetical protein YB2330_003984 [Saitoella coloradoensis]